VQQDLCDRRPLKNFGVSFNPGEVSRRIKVHVTVLDTTRLAELVGWNQDDLEITLLNRLNPSIEKPETVRLNETVTISAAIPVGGVSVLPTPPMRCTWSIDAKLIESNDCRISYTAPSTIPSEKSGVDVKITLALLDGTGNQIGVKEDTMEVRRRIGDIYAYAIDTTKRMDNPGRGPDLKTLVASLEKTISNKSLTTASLAIRTFGRAATRGDRDHCGEVDTILPMQSLDPTKISKSLSGVSVDGDRAPVLRATVESLDDLVKAARGNSDLYLVVISGGADACQLGDEQRTLDMITEAIRSASVPLRGFDLQVLALTLRITSAEEAGLLVQEIPPATGRRAEVPHFQFVVADQGTLNRALSAIAGLSDTDNARRRQSCLALVELLREQVRQAPRRLEDNSVNRLQSYCNRNRR
jgi:hypothetical protein